MSNDRYSHENMLREAQALWGGNRLDKTNPTDVGQALLEVHRRFWMGVELNDPDVLYSAEIRAELVAEAINGLANNAGNGKKK